MIDTGGLLGWSTKSFGFRSENVIEVTLPPASWMVPAESTDRLIIKGWPLRSERREAHMELIVVAVIALIGVGVAVAFTWPGGTP